MLDLKVIKVSEQGLTLSNSTFECCLCFKNSVFCTWCYLCYITDSLISRSALYSILWLRSGLRSANDQVPLWFVGYALALCLNKLYGWSQVLCLLCRCSDHCSAVIDSSLPLSLQAEFSPLSTTRTTRSYSPKTPIITANVTNKLVQNLCSNCVSERFIYRVPFSDRYHIKTNVMYGESSNNRPSLRHDQCHV